jgi:amidase
MSADDVQRLGRETATHTEYGSHLDPQLRVELGETFVVETNDNFFNSVKDSPELSQLSTPPLAAQQVIRGNPVAGPIYVEGVEAGDTLVVELESIAVRDWGWTGIVPGMGIMDRRVGWEELTGPFATVIQHEPGPSGTLEDGTAVMNVGREARWPLAPFLGVLATAPERGSENTVVTAGPWGGNIDVRDIKAGHRIHLNASHDGGLLFLGDAHASQGDSELTGIANETAADVTLRCDVIRQRRVPGVCRIETPTSLIQVDAARHAGSLEGALNSCFEHMIGWLVEEHGMDSREAYLHMTANSEVRINVYQFCLGLFTCGVEFPRTSL